jgi:hypothetical protein
MLSARRSGNRAYAGRLLLQLGEGAKQKSVADRPCGAALRECRLPLSRSPATLPATSVPASHFCPEPAAAMSRSVDVVAV